MVVGKKKVHLLCRAAFLGRCGVRLILFIPKEKEFRAGGGFNEPPGIFLGRKSKYLSPEVS